MLRFTPFPVFCLLFTLSPLLNGCGSGDDSTASPYLNLADSVQYTGMQTCRGCHSDIYNSFIQNGMGQSFGAATRDKSAGIFDAHALVYDSVLNFFYRPFFRNDSMFITEFRLSGKDTIHKRTEFISWIVGSGHHTNSHMVNFYGYVYQAPITFYTQTKRWDLAPGFEGGYNSRFHRMIQMECLSCHNGLPDLVEGSINKYEKVPLGIDCERCHGPGGLHVKEKLAGHLVDTASEIDYTIVNPAHLSFELQMSLCQRCHLQGVAVLNEGKDWKDFRPGMHLKEVMQVFLPEYGSAAGQFLMASQAERLRQSECFKHAPLTCITCHNPHNKIGLAELTRYNNACVNCHGGNAVTACELPMEAREEKDNNCTSCHMPKSGAIDIPHVTITDHYIRVPDPDPTNQLQTTDWMNPKPELGFRKLKSMANDNPTALDRARGYLRFYEGFNANAQFLDSAAYYLEKADQKSGLYMPAKVQLAYLREDYPAILEAVKGMTAAGVTDGYMAFRIGEAYQNRNDLNRAIGFYERAVALLPLQLDFLNRLGTAYISARRLRDGDRIFTKLINEQPKNVAGLSNLGILKINLGQTAEGEQLLYRALELDPDYQLAYENLLAYYRAVGNSGGEKRIMQRREEHARLP